MLDINKIFPVVQAAVKKIAPQASDQAIMQRIKDFQKKHPKVDDNLFLGVFLKSLQQGAPQVPPQSNSLAAYLQR